MLFDETGSWRKYFLDKYHCSGGSRDFPKEGFHP
jgi:hypothetical protein